jgi:hypothetical protein
VSSRVLFAAAAGAVLAAVVAVVALAGGDSGPEEEPLELACVEAWNDDEAALAYGRHNFNFTGELRRRVVLNRGNPRPKVVCKPKTSNTVVSP